MSSIIFTVINIHLIILLDNIIIIFRKNYLLITNYNIGVKVLKAQVGDFS
jgi:hypothetical protein